MEIDPTAEFYKLDQEVRELVSQAVSGDDAAVERLASEGFPRRIERVITATFGHGAEAQAQRQRFAGMAGDEIDRQREQQPREGA